MPSNTQETCPHPPRLCNIVRSPDFIGYGFNLHTIKNRTGQFIGQVDEGSPALRALLKEGDRIIEVNGVNIASENHKQVVSRIKMVPDETKLLVVDDEGDKWYKEHNIVISSSLPEVVKGYSNKSRHPSTSSSETDVKENKHEDRQSVGSASSAATSEASNNRRGEDSSDDDEPLNGKVTGPVAVNENASSSSSSEDEDASVESTEEKVLSNGKHEETQIEKDEGKTLETSEVNDVVVKTAAVEIKETPATDEENDDSSSSEEEEDEDDASVTESQKTVEQAQKAAPVVKAAEDSSEADSTSEKSTRSDSSVSASSHESNKVPPKPAVIPSKSPISASPSPPSSTGAPSPTPYNFKIDGLNMNMSAAQMREYLASKKKKDIRSSEIDMRKKYEIIQKL